MHTNNWRPLNTRDAESYEKKNYIYIFLAAPCGLAEFPVSESQCSGTSGTHFYQNKKVACTPPPPPRLTPSPIASFIKGVQVFMCYLRGAQDKTTQI
jgi:hypothetical protein